LISPLPDLALPHLGGGAAGAAGGGTPGLLGMEEGRASGLRPAAGEADLEEMARRLRLPQMPELP